MRKIRSRLLFLFVCFVAASFAAVLFACEPPTPHTDNPPDDDTSKAEGIDLATIADALQIEGDFYLEYEILSGTSESPSFWTFARKNDGYYIANGDLILDAVLLPDTDGKYRIYEKNIVGVYIKSAPSAQKETDIANHLKTAAGYLTVYGDIVSKDFSNFPLGMITADQTGTGTLAGRAAARYSLSIKDAFSEDDETLWKIDNIWIDGETGICLKWTNHDMSYVVGGVLGLNLFFTSECLLFKTEDFYFPTALNDFFLS